MLKDRRYSKLIKIDSIVNGEKIEYVPELNSYLNIYHIINMHQLYNVTSKEVFPNAEVCYEPAAQMRGSGGILIALALHSNLIYGNVIFIF